MPARPPASNRDSKRRFQPREIAVAEDDDMIAPPTPHRARGPLLLFLAGAVIALSIAAAQALGASPATWLTIIGGGGHANAARGAGTGGGEVVRSLDDLKARYGEPGDATYGRLRIPSIGVDAPLGKRSVGKDGILADPSGPGDVVWYEFGSKSGLGGTPGAGGNAVFAGHVDRNGDIPYAGVHYTGPGVFFSLDQVSAGDIIEVTAGAKTWRYGVVWAKQVPMDTNWESLFSSKVLGDSITLVTCGGNFDYDKHEYTSRLVVRAVRG